MEHISVLSVIQISTNAANSSYKCSKLQTVNKNLGSARNINVNKVTLRDVDHIS
jgi:hypothetical protein